ncbi:Uma2 family endonuclease [Leptolyngbya sp. NK1-12]|uniref:Uma2 family endonuclease n=1 Tax=Leptolyngbya sp. NK1-12 TaxID=2547451 RepID=A0AA97AJS4_9CYAN|nr:Uma2 family endonuclease [Leptolyngbya sp. NK1-12]WNZ22952.1 Uma2 family endonuclease [Leptolyngbya sp. NK1-12]
MITDSSDHRTVPSSDLPLKRWSVDKYHHLIAAGILTSDDHVELLDGQIVEMVPQDPPHASATDEGADYLKALFAGRAKIRMQLPITLSSSSEPEPDIAVVRIDPNRYRDRHPTPEDVFLLIEIADTTLSHDCHHKAKLYAKAGILEYWVVNLNQRQIIVYRHPQGDTYQSEQTLEATDTIAPLAFPEITVALKNLLF